MLYRHPHMIRVPWLSLLLGGCLLLHAQPARAQTTGPRAELSKAETRIRQVLLSTTDQTSVRRELKPLVDQYLDYDMLGQRSLARHWAKLSPEQQTEYLVTLRELIETAYLSRVTPANKSFTVQYLDEKVSGSDASVTTRVSSGKTEVELGFKLILVDGQWKAYDMIIDQVSLIQNYRAQFNRILRKSSFDDLIQRMQQRTKSIAPPKGG